MTQPAVPSPGPRRGEVIEGPGRRLRRRWRGGVRPRAEVARPTCIRLWLPLTPLWLLLAPFALLLAPLLTLLPAKRRARLVRAAFRVRPYRTAFALGAVLLALSGTEVSVDAPGALIRIKIY